jgi:hypothetical protein
MVAGWNPFFNIIFKNNLLFLLLLLKENHRAHILHFPNSTILFTKPTGRHYTKGRFTPRGRANSPWGRLHEILAFFGLEAGLNYTLEYDYNGGQFSHM